MRAADPRDLGKAVLLFVGAFLVYNANFRLIVEGDTVPARYIPYAILRDRTVALDGFAGIVERVPPGRVFTVPYWLTRSRNGRLVSAYPLVTPCLVSPVYVVAAALAPRAFWGRENFERHAEEMEKIAASLLAAISVGLMFVLLRRRIPRTDAVLLTSAYGFGTATWTIASQALWQHGTAEFLLTAALLGATAASGSFAKIAAGIAAGALAFNRPPDAVFSAAILGAIALRDRRRAWPAFVAAAAAAAPFLLYNVRTFGYLAGAYGATPFSHPFYSHPWIPGVAGLLASPARGILVFSPFFLFLAARRRGPRESPKDSLDRLLALACLAQLLFYARTDWRAGYSYGPRYLSDALPALVWLLAPVVPRLARAGRAVMISCIVIAVAIQAVGAFCYATRSDALYYPPDRPREEIGPAVWRPGDAPFLVEARGGIVRPDLFPGLRRLLP